MKAELSQRGGFYLDLPQEPGVLQFYLILSLHKGSLLEIRHRERRDASFDGHTWPDKEDKREYSVSRELASKTALCCFGLLPADLYADALQDEIPEAEWAAQQLREWAKWADSN